MKIRKRQRRWVQPLLGSIYLFDLIGGSVFAGTALARGPGASLQGRIGLGLLIMGGLCLWVLKVHANPSLPLTDHK